MSNQVKGILSVAAAFIFWGFVPIFWKQFTGITALELIVHRSIWGLLCLTLVLLWQRGRGAFAPVFSKQNTKIIVASSFCIGMNWLTFIWAVEHGHIVEVSLGYFINPLVNVVLGVLFLRERLRPIQWMSVGLASLGVGVLLGQNLGEPWISVVMPVTFGLYGLFHKFLQLDAQEGLWGEMGIFSFACIPLIYYLSTHFGLAFFQVSPALKWQMFLTGPVTVIPLLFFCFAAKHLTLTTLGLFQYFTPSLQLLVGVYYYHEAFTRFHAVAFICIWFSLGVFTAEGLYHRHQLKKSFRPL